MSVVYRLNVQERSYAKRSNVDIFTDGSRRRMLKHLRSCSAGYRAIGTLTYPREFDASEFRSHWRAFVERWRRLFASDHGASLFWFLEFQSNGQPHYHFYTNRFIEHGWLAVTWASITKTGNIDHYKAGTSIESIRNLDSLFSYAAKYAAKSEQKTMPDMYKAKGSGRWWGVVGDRSIVSAALVVDDVELAVFSIGDLIQYIRKSRNRIVYDEFGATVFVFDNISDFWDIFKRVKGANKVLFKAEQAYTSQLYRERRG